MAKSKFIRVLDEGTDVIFMVTKFEESDIPLLQSGGWLLSPELTMITHIAPQISSSMSTFNHPKYDIDRRSVAMDTNHTTCGVAKLIRDMEFDEIPDVLDVKDVVITA